MDKLTLLQAGPYTSLQRLPRWEKLAMGWPVGGPLEPDIAALMRRLLGIPKDAAVLEFFGGGLRMEATCPLRGLLWTPSTRFTFQGGPQHIRAGEFFQLRAGDRLKIPILKESYLGYLAFDRSLSTEITDKGTVRLVQKATLALGPKVLSPTFHARVQLPFFPLRTKPYELPVCAGPDFHLLDPFSLARLQEQPFTFSAAAFHRMGLRLSEHLQPHAHSLLSSPTQPGTVQWTPSGELILLGPDAQVTGGYPRILHLPESSRLALYRLCRGQAFIFSLNPRKSF
ncbi:allophanate hydrolase subunit 2 [Nitritalea halalkaliphila LW7]|uniref:Allophanate hydrolase subunit 2 n=1 Tax=Nitritalea halalkaliphila LW7 TaxID=1189621 RepID=I5C3R9_9BACT|nr:allophanate hydrolase subunit 2 [Nitritalea halalkaliphila]EIM76471.1 allophanate hydrolase subunit 2 [Nitritalea halalkaliphila LW7]